MRHAVVVILSLTVFAGAASAQNVLEPPGFTKTDRPYNA